MAWYGVVAVIPARRGSKGIPGKNHRVIAGKPLVSWVITAALTSREVDAVVVSTDDPEIREIAKGLGALVHDRSAASATDNAPTEAVLLEVLTAFPADRYVLLQPTSPLTTSADIDAAVAAVAKEGFDSLLSVAPQRRFVWEWGADGAVPVNYNPRARPRRQECEPLLVENGAIYVYSDDLLRDSGSRLGGRIGLHVMDADTYVEVDDPSDWDAVGRLLQERSKGSGVSAIRLVCTDVDGVLTDNGMYWSSDGSELKRFSARDGKGFELLHLAGIKTALITSESTSLVARRGEKLGCHRVVLGCADKVAAANELRMDLDLTWDEVAFIGDDVHDLGLLEAVGASFAPEDAVAGVRDAAAIVLQTRGGFGAFREAADLILESQGRLPRTGPGAPQ